MILRKILTAAILVLNNEPLISVNSQTDVRKNGINANLKLCGIFEAKFSFYEKNIECSFSFFLV